MNIILKYVLASFMLPVQALSAQDTGRAIEPDIELAKLWWPEQYNVWTPVGWKDHYFRFNVFYNGMLIAEPAPGYTCRIHSRPWVGQDFQLTFRASADGLPKPLPSERLSMWKIDGGTGVQGWTEGHETPVLWTEYRCQEGIVLKSEVFAHITSNGDVETALEPLYAWIRLSVAHVDELRYPETFKMSVLLSRVFVGHAEHFEYSVAVDVFPEKAPYPKELKSEPFMDNGQIGYRISEPDGKVRMVVLPADEKHVSFYKIADGMYNLSVGFRARQGEYVDLLLPMLPQPREETDRELALGYDGALTMSDWYWGRKPETAATFHVPERFVNEAIEQSIKFAPVIAEKDHITGEYSYLTGSWAYDALWTTPSSMCSHMFIDQMGYFDLTEKYSDVFYANQGTVKAPGDAYRMHPGYFSTHRILTSIDWLTDHGAVMHQLATHALLTGDRQFIERWTEPLIKACDFIVDVCALTDHGGIEGLLPPAVATDEIIPMQAVWNLAWNYKGMFTTVRLLEKLNHPKAAEYAAFLRKFKKTFVTEYRKTAEEGPRWTDRQGRKRYKPSTVMTNIQPKYHLYNDAFYLDGGPMVLVWAGLMEPDDPIMVDVADFFREGPNWDLWEPFYHAVDRALLVHEISTCEPAYSWNVYHTWKMGDRQRFLEGMYSILVGATSHNTYISCEHRHGVQGMICTFAVGFYLAKLAVIDDQISYGDLHLLRLCPHAWISSSEDTYFENMPTEFGPVDLKFRLSADGKTLQVSFRGEWREKPNKIILHVPRISGLEAIVINGRTYREVNEIELDM